MMYNGRNQINLERYLNHTIVLMSIALVFSISFSQGFYLLAMFLFAINLFKGKRWKRTTLEYPLILFLGTQLLSLFVTRDIHLSLLGLKKLGMVLIFFPVVFHLHSLNQGERVRRVDKIQACLIFSVFAAAIFASIKGVVGYEERVGSLSGGYSRFAAFLAFVYAMSLGRGFERRLYLAKWLWVLILSVFLFALSLTLTRSGWVSVLVVTIIVGALRGWKFSVGLALIFFVIAFSIPGVWERITTLIHPFQHTTERLILWEGAWMVFKDSPIFGNGLGTFKVVFPYFDNLIDKGVGDWHNDYIQTLVDSGVIGGFALIFLLIRVFSTGVWVMKQEIDDGEKKIFLGLFLAIISLFIIAFFQTIFRSSVILLALGLLLGCFSSLADGVKKSIRR